MMMMMMMMTMILLCLQQQQLSQNFGCCLGWARWVAHTSFCLAGVVGPLPRSLLWRQHPEPTPAVTCPHHVVVLVPLLFLFLLLMSLKWRRKTGNETCVPASRTPAASRQGVPAPVPRARASARQTRCATCRAPARAAAAPRPRPAPARPRAAPRPARAPRSAAGPPATARAQPRSPTPPSSRAAPPARASPQSGRGTRAPAPQTPRAPSFAHPFCSLLLAKRTLFWCFLFFCTPLSSSLCMHTTTVRVCYSLERCCGVVC